ncbi:uncharacterized protein LOC143235262 [Tachypleus tridentatus]|uniref:uncharacterized protein LOC143235262 n=1 Tax=Tachypleus tridentatus TaxID=6853 RepID=UPI003FD506C1
MKFLKLFYLMSFWTLYLVTVSAQVPPKIPDVFKAKAFVAISDGSNSRLEMIEDIYYDQPNNRFSETIKVNGSVIQTVIDFKTKEVLQIRGTNCKATTLTEDVVRDKNFPFIVEIDKSGNMTLKGGTWLNNATYLGPGISRGIPCDTWKSSINKYDVFGTSLRCDIVHYYSKPAWQPPSCQKIPCPVVPVKTESNCKTLDSTKSFVEIADVFDYSETILNTEVFQQPHGIFCIDKKPGQKLPTFPDYVKFGAESEIEFPDRVKQQLKVWYDKTHQVLRTDVILVATSGPIIPDYVTYLKDYKASISYVINKITGTCTINTMEKTQAPSVAEIVWGMDLNGSQVQFIGERRCRGHQCLVWSAMSKLNENAEEVSDLYILKDTVVENDAITVSTVPIGIRVYIITNTQEREDFQRSIFNYQTVDHDRFTAFDVSYCYANKNQIHLHFGVKGNFQKDSDSQMTAAKEEIVMNLSKKMNLKNPRRLSRFQVNRVDNRTLEVEVNLLEDPYSVFKVGTIKDDISNSQALENLKKWTTFSFTLGKNGEKFDVEVKKSNFYDVSSTDGYGTGAMAALGITMLILGLIIGAGGLALFFKIRSGSSMSNPLVKE